MPWRDATRFLPRHGFQRGTSWWLLNPVRLFSKETSFRVIDSTGAKLIEGEVSMDVHWGLEDEEVEQGYILTCQSHPKTEKVVVDFDVK